MKCPNCQFENREGVKFCEGCGSKLELVCPSCSARVPADRLFCGECGSSLKAPKTTPPVDYSNPQSYTPKILADKILSTRSSIEGERKLVTVLFADAANFTAMSEKLDPEEVHQIVDGCFKILMDEVHKYEGTITQFTGDGVMALFGAPVAHEDHAQRACGAALAIQKAMAAYGKKIGKDYGLDFRLRIGLNSGPVIVGSIGDDLRVDYTAIGDTVNMASRMEGLARPGSLLVSRNTHKLAADFFRFEPLGKVAVKGKEEMQEAYELISPSGVETRLAASVARGLTRFVGRRNSMAALMEAYEKVREGSGQVVGLVGEAGVGKSRLVLEFRSRLFHEEFTYLEGRCIHFGGAMAYLPILDILRSCFGIVEGELEFVIRKRMAEKFLRLDEKLEGNLPPLQDLLSLKVEDEQYLKLEPKQKRERIFEALRDLFIRLSQESILILVVEDLHWIDKTSEEFLDYLIGWLANAKILLILLHRPEYTHQWGSKSYFNRIGLTQLTLKSSAELVQAILEGAEVAPELRDLILNRTAGNPLFMEELTHTLLENGSIQMRDHQYVLAQKPSDLQVPDTVQGIITARMDRLEENLKRIMQVASVIGREFAFRILQAISGMREELKTHLFNLQGLEFIYEKSLFPELEYIFKHALIQEVAYNSLLLKRRKEIHERIGRAIEELYPQRLGEFYEMLAYHYGRSTNSEKAVDYLAKANQRAIQMNAILEAKVHFNEAMRLLDILPSIERNRERRILLLKDNWEVFESLFKIPEYYSLLKAHEPIAKDLRNLGLVGTFYCGIGTCEWWLGLLEDSSKTLSKAAELVVSSGHVVGIEMVYASSIWNHLWRGEYRGVLKLAEEVERLMDTFFAPYFYVRALTGASWAYSQLGQWDRALETGQKGLEIAGKLSNDSFGCFAAFAISMAHAFRGDAVHALEFGELAVQKARSPADQVWAQTGFSWALCQAGKPQKGTEVLKSLIQMYRAVSFAPGEIFATVLLSEGYRSMGERDRAAQTIKSGLERAEQCGMKFLVGRANRILGEIALESESVEAEDRFIKSLTVLGEIGAENDLALAYASYGRFHRQRGRVAEASEYLKRALEILDRLGTLIEPDKVRQELAELH